MSVAYIPVYPGIVAITVTAVLREMLRVGELEWIVVALGLTGLLSAAWYYSPLPNNNGGIMAPDAGRYWGFSTKQDKD